MLTTRNIYISYIVKNFRKNINSKLKNLNTITKKKKFIRRLRNPRHVNFLSEFSTINYKEFKVIIENMNKKVCIDIIEGKSLKLGYNLGYIYIKEFKRKFKISENGKYNTRKNWGESKRRKKQLLSEGRLPIKYYKDETGKIVGNNGGEEWIIYYTEDNILRFSWWKMIINNITTNKKFNPLKNISTYLFKPTKDNRLILSSSHKQEELELI